MPAFPGGVWVQLPPGFTPPLISRGGCGGLDVLAPDFEPFLFCRLLFYVPPAGVQGGACLFRAGSPLPGADAPLLWRPLGATGGAIYFISICFMKKGVFAMKTNTPFFIWGERTSPVLRRRK